MKYLGIWYGGNSYAMSNWVDHTELFKSLDYAKRVLHTRYTYGFSLPVPQKVVWDYDTERVTLVEGDNLICPSVDIESQIWLIAYTPDITLRDVVNGYPDYIVSLGNRGGVKVEKQ